MTTKSRASWHRPTARLPKHDGQITLLGSSRPWPGSPARPLARTGCATASNPRTPAPRCGPAAARPRRTSPPTSATAADASSSAASGPPKIWPTTATTAAPTSSPFSDGPDGTPSDGDTTGDRSARGSAARAASVVWELAKQTDPDVRPLSLRLLTAIAHASQWRAEYRTARDSPPPVVT